MAETIARLYSMASAMQVAVAQHYRIFKEIELQVWLAKSVEFV